MKALQRLGCLVLQLLLLLLGARALPSPSTIFFNDTSSKRLGCEPSEATPGFLTTTFLSNDPFAFGCLSSDAASYFLSVALSSQNFPNVPLWVANRYRPVKDNATLQKAEPGGHIELRDVDGALIWSSPGSGDVVGMSLRADGNLVLFDDGNNTVWQSFDQPIDLLIPGQTLRAGQTLVSGFSTTLFPATDNFTARMTPGGLVLYASDLPYFAIQYPFHASTVDDVLSSPCNHTVLQLSSDSLTLIQDLNTSACSLFADRFTSHGLQFDTPVLFLRLDPDGNVRGYHADFKPSFGLFETTTRGVCGIPNACGPYGICEAGSCECPSAAAANGTATGAVFSNASSTAGNRFPLTDSVCVPQTPLPECTSDSNHHNNNNHPAQQDFVDISHVDYFANDFIPATTVAQTSAECRAACAANCSCKAAFFRGSSHQCFLHTEVKSMLRIQDSSYVASIKFQRPGAGAKSKSDTKLIIGISVATVGSILFLGVWHFSKGRSRPGPHTILLRQDDELLASLPGQPRRFSFKELRAATWELSEKLGVGGFGSVYRGVLPDGSKVAVKQLENAAKTIQGLKEFRAEVVVLSNINHQNLVHLRGFCADGAHRLLVYEYVANGSLDTWLFRTGGEPKGLLNWRTRHSIAVHTARGLFFLHEQCRIKVVHLDIKPQNILLDENFVAKLADFGLSRLIQEDQSSALTRMRGTPGYMAPECLILSDATEKSDIYSFGMVLLEIISGRKNVDVSRLVRYGDEEGWYFPAMASKKLKEGNFDDIIDKGLGQLDPTDRAEAIKVIYIAFWCIQDEPSLRPTMGNVLLMLEGYANVTTPPLSFHFGMRFHRSSTLEATATTSNTSMTNSTSCSSNSVSVPVVVDNVATEQAQTPSHKQEEQQQSS